MGAGALDKYDSGKSEKIEDRKGCTSEVEFNDTVVKYELGQRIETMRVQCRSVIEILSIR